VTARSKQPREDLVLKRTLALGLIVCAAVGAYATLAGASSTRNDRFTASLNRGQEVPKPKGVSVRASGRFSATLSGSKLKWTLTFKHLTGNATAAHIHSGKRGKAGHRAHPEHADADEDDVVRHLEPLQAGCPVALKTIDVVSAHLIDDDQHRQLGRVRGCRRNN